MNNHESHPPRFFRELESEAEWEWRNGKMTVNGDDSIFTSPGELLECPDVFEVDEFGAPLPVLPDPDREYQIRKDNES